MTANLLIRSFGAEAKSVNDIPERIELLGKIVVLENEVACQRRHAENWRRLAGHYDDIRYALRNAPDTPEGHTEFYNECAELIFGADH